MEPGEGRAVAIVLAAGAGRRVGAEEPKAFLSIGGRPMLAVAVGAAAASPLVGAVIVAAPGGWEERAETPRGLRCSRAGGDRGRDAPGTVRAALDAVSSETSIVAIHDAARPFAPPDLFTAVIAAVNQRTPGAVPVPAGG